MLSNSHALSVMCLGLTVHPITRGGGGDSSAVEPHTLNIPNLKKKTLVHHKVLM